MITEIEITETDINIDTKSLEMMRKKHEQRQRITFHYEQTVNTLIQELEESASTKENSPRTPLTSEERERIKYRLQTQSKKLKESRESLDNLESYGYSPNSCSSSADNLDSEGEDQEETLRFKQLSKLSLKSS